MIPLKIKKSIYVCIMIYIFSKYASFAYQDEDKTNGSVCLPSKSSIHTNLQKRQTWRVKVSLFSKGEGAALITF